MEMPPAPSDADETLAAIGHRIYRSFRSLETESRSREGEDSFSSDLVDASQRFGLWAKNLGLYNLGHSSLDYRFRDAPVVCKYTRHLLIDLEKSISEIRQDLDPRKPGRETDAERPYSPVSDQAAGMSQDDVEDQGSDESSEDEEALMSYQEDSISTIVLENARLIIDRLYKLSFKIRNPATRLGLSNAKSYREVDEETGVDLMDWYASFDLRHVVKILAQCWQKSEQECESHYLVQRLARTNTLRRRQFGHWRRHRLKLESADKAFAQTMRNETNVQANSTLLKIPGGSEIGALSLPSAATRLDENNVKLNDTASITSGSTYAGLFTDDDENGICIPALPKKLCTGKEFECPYCHVLCSKRISNKTAWERHVIKDLRPYVCTYENCTEADQQYDGIKDWVNHEINAHRDTKLQTTTSGEGTSDDRGQSQTSKLVTPNDTCHEECPFCLERDPSFVHVGRHLQRVAVFALPRSTGVEDENSVEGTDLKAPNDEDRDSLPVLVSSAWDSDSDAKDSGGFSLGEEPDSKTYVTDRDYEDTGESEEDDKLSSTTSPTSYTPTVATNVLEHTISRKI